MVKGAEEISARGSIWSSVFIVGPGGPGGVRLPWARSRVVPVKLLMQRRAPSENILFFIFGGVRSAVLNSIQDFRQLVPPRRHFKSNLEKHQRHGVLKPDASDFSRFAGRQWNVPCLTYTLV